MDFIHSYEYMHITYSTELLLFFYLLKICFLNDAACLFSISKNTHFCCRYN